MKKFTFLLVILTTIYVNAQFTTGEITLNSAMSVIIETQTDQVSLTLKGPSDKWFAIGFGGNSMSTVTDVFLFDGTGNFDNVGHIYSQPTNDSNQDWTLVSNDISGTDRIIVATRDLSTADSNDFTFVNATSAIPVIWAFGSSMTLEQHAASNRGFTSLPRTAVAALNNKRQIQFALYPNPVQTELNIVLPSNLDKATVEIYDILGKRINQNKLKSSFNTVNISNLNSGIYIIKIIGADNTYGVKQFVKK